MRSWGKLAVLAVPLLAGCVVADSAGPPAMAAGPMATPAYNVQVVAAAAVRGCQPLGAVREMVDATGEAAAEQRARDHAARLGATRMVWTAQGAGGIVAGNIYRCQASVQPAVR